MREYDTKIVCRVLEVSERSYYRRLKESYKQTNPMLTEAVVTCFHKHNGNYGRRRIQKALLRQGVNVSVWKIERILKASKLVAKVGRKKSSVPKKVKPEYTSENLVKDKFVIKEKNQLWCADISEFHYADGKLYASAIIDVGTRKIMGWKIDRNQRQSLVQDSIKQAYHRFKPAPGLVFHCDRGVQYTANKTKKLLDKFGMKSSMSRPGTPSDNQPIESFWKTLKQEMSDVSKLPFDEASREIVRYMEMYYNAERIHSSLGYMTPNEAWEKSEK